LLTAEPVKRLGHSVERPKTQYAKSGDLHIAYQTFGQGPPDIVFVFPYMTHVEAGWEVPQLAQFYEGLSRIGRLVLFDAVGSGMSDPALALNHAGFMDERPAGGDGRGGTRAENYPLHRFSECKGHALRSDVSRASLEPDPHQYIRQAVSRGRLSRRRTR
jgi:hypothetical protein